MRHKTSTITYILLTATLLFSGACSDEETYENSRPLTKHEIQSINRLQALIEDTKITIDEPLDLPDPVITDTQYILGLEYETVDLGKIISYNLLKQADFDIQKLPPVYPETLSQLNGCEVTMISFMDPLDQIDNASRFLLIPQHKSCYYCSGTPNLLDMIYVVLKKGTTTPIFDDPVKVTGRLKLLSGSAPLKSRKGGYENKMVYSLLDATVSKAQQSEMASFIAKSEQFEPEEDLHSLHQSDSMK